VDSGLAKVLDSVGWKVWSLQPGCAGLSLQGGTNGA
jgi:hypothetical protein